MAAPERMKFDTVSELSQQSMKMQFRELKEPQIDKANTVDLYTPLFSR